MELILASASPRRREILGRIVKDFSVLPARGEEKSAETQPVPLVISLARAKAEEVASSHPKAAVLGADTVVWFEGRALGKPKDAADAKRTLRALSGRAHTTARPGESTPATRMVPELTPRPVTRISRAFLPPPSSVTVPSSRSRRIRSSARLRRWMR